MSPQVEKRSTRKKRKRLTRSPPPSQSPPSETKCPTSPLNLAKARLDKELEIAYWLGIFYGSDPSIVTLPAVAVPMLLQPAALPEALPVVHFPPAPLPYVALPHEPWPPFTCLRCQTVMNNFWKPDCSCCGYVDVYRMSKFSFESHVQNKCGEVQNVGAHVPSFVLLAPDWGPNEICQHQMRRYCHYFSWHQS